MSEREDPHIKFSFNEKKKACIKHFTEGKLQLINKTIKSNQIKSMQANVLVNIIINVNV